jgi:hypothetical protein
MNIASVGLLLGKSLLQSQALGSIFGSDNNGPNVGRTSGASDLFSSLLSQQIGKNKPDAALAALLNPSKSANGLSATGRNLSLFNPEAGYNLSTFINSRDVLYKAQFSGLSQIKHGVAQLQAAGEGLGKISNETPAAGVEALLQNFIGRYNHWRESFNADVADGGLLDNVQAAEISLYELEQSVKNTFIGAKDDIRGLRELGITIDPNTHFAALDSKQLAATLSSKPQGVVNAIQDFSANFVKSAALLNSANNFIPNQLDNLGRAINYIRDNQAALKLEFGAGDTPKPNARIAQALAAYNRISA